MVLHLLINVILYIRVCWTKHYRETSSQFIHSLMIVIVTVTFELERLKSVTVDIIGDLFLSSSHVFNNFLHILLSTVLTRK